MRRQRPFAIPHQLRWAVGAAILASILLTLGLVQAQPPAPARAGVVIQFGDGHVTRACIELGDDGQATGEEALLAVGLPVLVEAGAVGVAVCKVDGEGCDYPATSCFCQCSLGAGTACHYWAYNRLVNGQWQLSNIGASNTIVHTGDVEGWAWGNGSVSSGARPPQTTYDEVCAVALATSTATATPTPAPSQIVAEPSATATAAVPVVYVPVVGQPVPVTPPSVSPSAVAVPTATTAPAPTATAVATPAPAPLRATAAPTTQSASAVPTAPATVAPSLATAAPAPTAARAPTATAAASELPTQPLPVITTATAAAQEHTATATIALPSPPTATERSATQRPTRSPSATTNAGPTAMPQAVRVTVVPTATESIEPTGQRPSQGAPPASYLALGLLMLGLALGWGIVRVRRSR